MLHLRVPFFCVAIAILWASCPWTSSSEARVPESFSSGQAMNFTLEGEINTLGQNKFTVRAEENIIFHVRYDDKTEFKSDDSSPATSKDLRVGLKVRVEGDLTESGEIVAQRIELRKAPPKK